jgi:hypothetical protein
MNVTMKLEGITIRRVARATAALAAIAAVAVGASSLPTSAATTIAKSRAADIASGATRVVVHVNRGLNAKTGRYSAYATTNVATLNTIIERVNALPKAPPAGEMCPMDVGAKLKLSFFRHSAKPYAIVVADPGGCGAVSIRNYNANDSLEGSATAGGGATFSAYVATQLHIKTLQVI